MSWHFIYLHSMVISGGLSQDFAGSSQNRVTAKTSSSRVESQYKITEAKFNKKYLFCNRIGLIQSYLRL